MKQIITTCDRCGGEIDRNKVIGFVTRALTHTNEPELCLKCKPKYDEFMNLKF